MWEELICHIKGWETSRFEDHKEFLVNTIVKKLKELKIKSGTWIVLDGKKYTYLQGYDRKLQKEVYILESRRVHDEDMA